MLNSNVIGILLGLFSLAIVFFVRKHIHMPYAKSVWRASLLLFSFYTIILIAIEVRWYHIQEYAESFDLDQNGFVDLDEYTDEALNALNRVTQDTTRNFAFITIAILSSALSFSFLLADLAVIYLKNKKNS